jgi:hypothetical protein
MKDKNELKRTLPFVIEFVKFTSGFAALIALGLLVLNAAS